MNSINPIGTVPPAPASIHWITEPDALDQWLLEGQGEPLALDTEFERVSTFFPIPGLVQLGMGSRYCLVDPEVAEQSQEFRRVLTDADTVKLLYAMSEDLELFRQWLDLEPLGVVDLQIGAALAGAGFSVGYARLVETLFGETLDKSATRSDWVSRPLSEAQQRYALDDIRFLVPIYHWVLDNLSARDLEEALFEESARFAAELSSQDDPDQHYLKLRGGWALAPQKQLVLQMLVMWREEECRRRDRPRSRVVADPLLIAIADRMPGDRRALANIQGLPQPVTRRYGETLLDLVREGGAASTAGLTPIPAPLTRDEQGFYKQVKRVIASAAEAADVPIELLAPRKRLEVVVRQRKTAAGLFNTGWRSQVIAPVGEQLEELLRS
ncbi:ribonuclease D [Marinobacter sp.]|uniref:ribonuclease D n=1 Tax=Marinobacter sp. TaxID=50741 RepID=UPI0034A4E91E